MSHKTKSILLATLLITLLTSSVTYATLAPLTPPPPGGYDSGPNSILDPGCLPNAVDCVVNLPSGGSGWSLTGNAGTTPGTNFIGTTDAQDFMVKTNGNQIALFGQNGNVAIGSATIASGISSFAAGSATIASGTWSTAFGDSTNATGDFSTAFGNGGLASGSSSTSFGSTTTASGNNSTSFGESSFASGDISISAGNNTLARSFSEISLGMFNVDYTPASSIVISLSDKLLSIGNGDGSGGANDRHNAYTLWKDGSFVYNDDNFQNDNLGTEQNMFYFNYGNHDGLGGANTKRAIRLGSAYDNGWDINSANVGNNSVAIGFDDAGFGSFPFASGENSIALGWTARAEGDYSFASSMGIARGANSIAISGEANGPQSRSFGGIATGGTSTSIGVGVEAFSFMETAMGSYTTNYIPNNLISWDTSDRLLIIGGGDSNPVRSDALTILKNGQTGIAIDNFEANTNGNIFQVGDGSTGIIGYVDNGTGAWVAVSDERQKHNITNTVYGLNEIMQIRPVSFDYNRNNEHTIGFLAQQVKDIIPEAVFGSEEKGYGMSYATLTPALVKAIQELNLKVDTLQLANGTTSTNIFDSLKGWLADTANGIQKIFAHEVQTDKLCVGNTCVNEQQLQQLLQNQSIPSTSPNPDPTPSDPVTTPSDENPPVVTPDPGNGDNTSTPSDPGMSPVTDTPASE